MISSRKIENAKTELSRKKGINDYDIVNIARSTEKSLCHAYVTAIEEVSHDGLFSLLSNMLKETAQQQRKLLDLQFQHGWIAFMQADERVIKELEREFTESRQQLK